MSQHRFIPLGGNEQAAHERVWAERGHSGWSPRTLWAPWVGQPHEKQPGIFSETETQLGYNTPILPLHYVPK